MNGAPTGAPQAVAVARLSGLVFSAATAAGGTDVLQMRAYDGTQWSSWVQQTITDPGTQALRVGTPGNDTLVGNAGNESFSGGGGRRPPPRHRGVRALRGRAPPGAKHTPPTSD